MWGSGLQARVHGFEGLGCWSLCEVVRCFDGLVPLCKVWVFGVWVFGGLCGLHGFRVSDIQCLRDTTQTTHCSTQQQHICFNNTQHTTHEHPTHNTQHTTHNTQHTTHNTQHTTHKHPTHKHPTPICFSPRHPTPNTQHPVDPTPNTQHPTPNIANTQFTRTPNTATQHTHITHTDTQHTTHNC